LFLLAYTLVSAAEKAFLSFQSLLLPTPFQAYVYKLYKLFISLRLPLHTRLLLLLTYVATLPQVATGTLVHPATWNLPADPLGLLLLLCNSTVQASRDPPLVSDGCGFLDFSNSICEESLISIAVSGLLRSHAA